MHEGASQPLLLPAPASLSWQIPFSSCHRAGRLFFLLPPGTPQGRFFHPLGRPCCPNTSLCCVLSFSCPSSVSWCRPSVWPTATMPPVHLHLLDVLRVRGDNGMGTDFCVLGTGHILWDPTSLAFPPSYSHHHHHQDQHPPGYATNINFRKVPREVPTCVFDDTSGFGVLRAAQARRIF